MRSKKQPRTADGRFASWNTLAKGLGKSKTSTKVSKKSVAVPKKEQIKAPNLEPLKEFAGYTLGSKDTRVVFGCGAVIVQKSDLLLLADLVETEKGRQQLAAFINLKIAASNYRSMADIANLSSNTLRRIAAVKRKAKC